MQSSQDGSTWRDRDTFSYAVTQPSGLITGNKAYANGQRYLKVLLLEALTGNYVIEINTSDV